MNKVNNMRARILKKFMGEIDVCKIMSLMLKNSPSCVINYKCDICKSRYAVEFVFLQIQNSNDFSKLNNFIANYLNGIKSSQHFCDTCQDMMSFSELTFNYHLFVTLKKYVVSLAEIPEVIKLNNEDYVLFGGILYLDPLIEGDKGHYITAIKINATWNIFDDKKTKPYFVSSKKTFTVDTLLYTNKSGSYKNTEKSLCSGVDIVWKNPLKRKAENSKENDATAKKFKDQMSLSKETSIEQIAILRNGCSFNVNGSRVFLRNTCGFDTVVQVNNIFVLFLVKR